MGGFVWSRNVVNVMICVKCSWCFSQGSRSSLGFPNVCASHLGTRPGGSSFYVVSGPLLGSVSSWLLLEQRLNYRNHAKKGIANPCCKLTSLK